MKVFLITVALFCVTVAEVADFRKCDECKFKNSVFYSMLTLHLTNTHTRLDDPPVSG